ALDPGAQPSKAMAAAAPTDARADRPADRSYAVDQPLRGAAPPTPAATRGVARVELENAGAPSPAPPAPEVKTETSAKAEGAPPVVFLTASSVKSRIERCIKDTQSDHPTSMKVSIASTLTINVDADGAVHD